MLEKNHLRFKKAMDFMKNEMNYTYTDIVLKLENHKQKIKDKRYIPGTSRGQLNKHYKTPEQNPVRKVLITFVESYLNSLRITWNEQSKNYQYEEGVTIEDSFELKKPFKNVKGVYQMYHLSHFGDTILKNIIRISEDGEVCIDAYSACRHRGEAEIFKGSFLSIQMHTLIHPDGEEEKFYYHIFANLDGNMQNGEIFHFFGISTTVSITNEAMANKRVFVKLSDDENQQNEEWFHELIYTDNQDDIEKLNESKAGRIADFLTENSSLIIKEKTNQKMR